VLPEVVALGAAEKPAAEESLVAALALGARSGLAEAAAGLQEASGAKPGVKAVARETCLPAPE
jgi:hypothetical protein